MKKNKKGGVKSISLAFYFGLLILLIIIISLTFKTLDLIRNSKFDSNNRFTVAVLNDKKVDLISVSPSTGLQIGVSIENIKSLESLERYSFPVDVFVKSDSDFSSESKHIFLKMLFNKRSLGYALNILDLVKLSVYSLGVDNDNFSYQKFNLEDEEELAEISSKEFIDETISNDKVSIQVINAAEIGGLGNNVARTITNLGGNVVLVNSSKEEQSESIIYYKEESYTVKKLSEILNVRAEKKDTSSISDIVIILGKDQEK